MKALTVLASLVALLPATSFARQPYCAPASGHYQSPACYPRSYVGWGGYYPYGWYAPAVSFSYYSAPRVYPVARYSVPYAVSVEASVQRALKRQGYYRGLIDGDIGPESRAAIRRYQIDRGLDVTGRVDRSLIRSLGV